MLSLNHGRAQVQRVEVGARARRHARGDAGGARWPTWAAYPVGRVHAGDDRRDVARRVHLVARVAYRGFSVVTNATPMMAYRGAGRPEAAALVERAVDLVAAELAMDPVEVRRQEPDPDRRLPVHDGDRQTYDTGDYARSLDEALGRAGYEELRAEQRQRRERGDRLLLGIGVATYVEITSFSSKEHARVEVDQGRLGARPHGDLAARSGPRDVASRSSRPACSPSRWRRSASSHSDTGVVERGQGTWGSRSLQVGGSSVAVRADGGRRTGRTLAAARARGGRGRPRGPGRRRVPRRRRARSRGDVVGARGAPPRGPAHSLRRRSPRGTPARRSRSGRTSRSSRSTSRPARSALRTLSRRGRLRPHAQPGARPRASSTAAWRRASRRRCSRRSSTTRREPHHREARRAT